MFGLRESRSAAVQGSPVPTESNVLVDGTLIDLCGATLLWRSKEGKKMNLINRIKDGLFEAGMVAAHPVTQAMAS